MERAQILVPMYDKRPRYTVKSVVFTNLFWQSIFVRHQIYLWLFQYSLQCNHEPCNNNSQIKVRHYKFYFSSFLKMTSKYVCGVLFQSRSQKSCYYILVQLSPLATLLGFCCKREDGLT